MLLEIWENGGVSSSLPLRSHGTLVNVRKLSVLSWAWCMCCGACAAAEGREGTQRAAGRCVLAYQLSGDSKGPQLGFLEEKAAKRSVSQQFMPSGG